MYREGEESFEIGQLTEEDGKMWRRVHDFDVQGGNADTLMQDLSDYRRKVGEEGSASRERLAGYLSNLVTRLLREKILQDIKNSAVNGKE